MLTHTDVIKNATVSLDDLSIDFDRATGIRNLVVLVKFLVALGKRAAVNVEP